VSRAAEEPRDVETEAVGREPYGVVRVARGVVAVLDFDPDGFLGRDKCICGDPEDDHYYDMRSGRGRSRFTRACTGFVPRRRAQSADAAARARLPERPPPSFGRAGERGASLLGLLLVLNVAGAVANVAIWLWCGTLANLLAAVGAGVVAFNLARFAR
jgi:hypothetical protein